MGNYMRWRAKTCMNLNGGTRSVALKKETCKLSCLKYYQYFIHDLEKISPVQFLVRSNVFLFLLVSLRDLLREEKSAQEGGEESTDGQFHGLLSVLHFVQSLTWR